MLKEWIKSLALYIKKSKEVRSKDINGKPYSKSSRVLSNFAFVGICFFLCFCIPNGVIAGFTDYIKDIFAIFVGFFVTVLTFVFDKLDMDRIPSQEEMDKIPADKRWSATKILRAKHEHNYTIRFFYTIGLIIIYAIFVLILLIPPIFWNNFFDIDFSKYIPLLNPMEMHWENVLIGIHYWLCVIYRTLITCFTVKVFYYTLYSTSSLLQVLISKKKIDTWN